MYASDVCGARSLDFKRVDTWRFSERQTLGAASFAYATDASVGVDSCPTALFEGVRL
jgi:hypothetical protein